MLESVTVSLVCAEELWARKPSLGCLGCRRPCLSDLVVYCKTGRVEGGEDAIKWGAKGGLGAIDEHHL